ncbi:CoA-binding protein [Peptoniphilus obesi]|uniref:CoA-binding protein n=1 Tax=Peptoniphilus obesi TaxID=1472765 RepID=UPI0004B539C2|nr:CoA-binding protein [Peptoniphilus obesi]
MTLKDEMFKKEVWAVIGITDKTERFGYKIPKLLEEKNYKVYGVNPKLDELEGIKVYKNLSQVPEKIDVINMIVNPKFAKTYLEEAKELGIKNVFFQPGSYQEETIEYAKELGFNIVTDCVYASLR